MSQISTNPINYDDVLASILQEQQSIVGFLSTIFSFLARRTDFYYVRKSPSENLGFAEGVAKDLLVRIFHKCDPINGGTNNLNELSDEIMTSTVAHEIEIASEESDHEYIHNEHNYVMSSNFETMSLATEVELSESTKDSGKPKGDVNKIDSPKDSPPIIPLQKNSEAYNGAVTDKYSWSQTISELEVTLKLPPDLKSTKNVSVDISSTKLCIKNIITKEIFVQGDFLNPIKASDVCWTISGGKLVINIEKQKEQWWKSLLTCEPSIDLSKIDCSRPMEELPESHIAKIQELQWNQQQKIKGLPTSSEIKNLKILEQAWNKDDSPFKGTKFDPNSIRFD